MNRTTTFQSILSTPQLKDHFSQRSYQTVEQYFDYITETIHLCESLIEEMDALYYLVILKENMIFDVDYCEWDVFMWRDVLERNQFLAVLFEEGMIRRFEETYADYEMFDEEVEVLHYVDCFTKDNDFPFGYEIGAKFFKYIGDMYAAARCYYKTKELYPGYDGYYWNYTISIRSEMDNYLQSALFFCG
eukprot:TRINITY_DN5700_c0_g1_i1.p2 TRINITY_DN5700_c0_g1~~TRINITY_DN5700_c0_g1_i1.p2  ORF type:complete len:189 (+),score=37.21 TRINITY_DN5700_c0_g1_i1:117-683(+)